MLRRNEGEKKPVSVDKQTKADSSVLGKASRQIKKNKIKKLATKDRNRRTSCTSRLINTHEVTSTSKRRHRKLKASLRSDRF